MKSNELIYGTLNYQQVVLVIIVCGSLFLFKEQQSEAVKVNVRNKKLPVVTALSPIFIPGGMKREVL